MIENLGRFSEISENLKIQELGWGSMQKLEEISGCLLAIRLRMSAMVIVWGHWRGELLLETWWLYTWMLQIKPLAPRFFAIKVAAKIWDVILVWCDIHIYIHDHLEDKSWVLFSIYHISSLRNAAMRRKNTLRENSDSVVTSESQIPRAELVVHTSVYQYAHKIYAGCA